jgi:CHAT domain
MVLEKTILVLASNPTELAKLKLKNEFNAIKEGVKRFSNDSVRYRVESVWDTRPIEIHRAILEYRPQILHFCGHGDINGLTFENEQGQAQNVSGQALATLLQSSKFQKHLECVVLNACYSENQSDEIVQHINYVVGIKDTVRDQMAINFSIGFYEALGSIDSSFEDAFEIGKSVVEIMDNVNGNFVLKKNYIQKLHRS